MKYIYCLMVIFIVGCEPDEFIAPIKTCTFYKDSIEGRVNNSYTFDKEGNLVIIEEFGQIKRIAYQNKKVFLIQTEGKPFGNITNSHISLTQYIYGNNGNIIETRAYNALDEVPYFVQFFFYNQEGYMVKDSSYSNFFGLQFNEKNIYTYDAKGNKISKGSYQNNFGVWEMTGTATFQYDYTIENNIEKSLDYLKGSLGRRGYNAVVKADYNNGSTEEFSYDVDEDGNIKSIRRSFGPHNTFETFYIYKCE